MAYQPDSFGNQNGSQTNGVPGEQREHDQAAGQRPQQTEQAGFHRLTNTLGEIKAAVEPPLARRLVADLEWLAGSVCDSFCSLARHDPGLVPPVSEPEQGFWTAVQRMNQVYFLAWTHLNLTEAALNRTPPISAPLSPIVDANTKAKPAAEFFAALDRMIEEEVLDSDAANLVAHLTARLITRSFPGEPSANVADLAEPACGRQVLQQALRRVEAQAKPVVAARTARR